MNVEWPWEYNDEVITLDKYEYKVRADEIKALISEGEFAEAVSIADTIDWRRVKSVMMLCTISDLYKINRRYQESKDILLLAYEKHPTGRLIVYSLCELSIKMEEYVQAIEYYKEFVQIAPKDTGKYILQYRLYEAQDVSLEERIAVLEEFKKRDYREKWAYELAYLYHRIGLATKCVEECDEMFLWFGEGKYVVKALELKALHEPLNENQRTKYDAWTRERDGGSSPREESGADDVLSDMKVEEQIIRTEESGSAVQDVSAVPTTELPEVKTVDVGQYNTINLQMALAESMKEIMSEDVSQESSEKELSAEIGEDIENIDKMQSEQELEDEDISGPVPMEEELRNNAEIDSVEEELGDIAEIYSAEEEAGDNAEIDSAEEELGDVAETVSVIEEPEEEDEEQPSIAEALIAPLLQETIKMPAPEEVEDQMRQISASTAEEETASFDAQQIVEQIKQDAQQAIAASGINRITEIGSDALTPLNVKPSKYDNFLSQEYDGQIRLVMPEAARVEKQITGQLSIDDIMAEWEETKRASEQRRMEEVRQRILVHTGSLFADFDEATKNGLLEELERAFIAALMKDSDMKPAVKEVTLSNDDDAINSALEIVKSEAEELAVNAASHDQLLDDDIDDVVEEPEEIEEFVVDEAVDVEPDEEIPDMADQTAGVVAEEKSVGKDVVAAEESTWGSAHDRELTAEEQELFGQFMHQRKTKRQLVYTLDNMSLASCTGNVIITGEKDVTTLLAKALIKEMQLIDHNFSGKVAKISANALNKKDVAETFARLDNGALIIENASNLKPLTVSKMTKVLEKDNMGLLLIMIDKKQNINELLADHTALNNNFNLRVDIEALNDEALVSYAKQYAEEMEYSIDEFGILALHTRIADRQTSDHEVSVAEVRELINEAISYANKKTPRHFVDILLEKRYDEKDMIILRERDFMHY